MHVANLELCKELYELSGWDDPMPIHWTQDAGPEDAPFSLAYGTPRDGSNGRGIIPAYGLGYLMQKLPRQVESGRFNELILTNQGDWSAAYGYLGDFSWLHWGATPEDATCRLAVELFKQGVLTKGGK